MSSPTSAEDGPFGEAWRSPATAARGSLTRANEDLLNQIASRSSGGLWSGGPSNRHAVDELPLSEDTLFDRHDSFEQRQTDHEDSELFSGTASEEQIRTGPSDQDQNRSSHHDDNGTEQDRNQDLSEERLSNFERSLLPRSEGEQDQGLENSQDYLKQRDQQDRNIQRERPALSDLTESRHQNSIASSQRNLATPTVYPEDKKPRQIQKDSTYRESTGATDATTKVRDAEAEHKAKLGYSSVGTASRKSLATGMKSNSVDARSRNDNPSGNLAHVQDASVVDKDLYKLRLQYIKRLKAEKAAVRALEATILEEKRATANADSTPAFPQTAAGQGIGRNRNKSNILEQSGQSEDHKDLIDVLTSAIDDPYDQEEQQLPQNRGDFKRQRTVYNNLIDGSAASSSSIISSENIEIGDEDVISARPLPSTSAQNAFFSQLAFTTITDSHQKTAKNSKSLLSRRIRGHCKLLKFDVKLFVEVKELNICELRANYSTWAKPEIAHAVQRICNDNHVVNLFHGFSEYAKLACRRAAIFAELHNRFGIHTTKFEGREILQNERIRRIQTTAFLGVSTLLIGRKERKVMITWSISIDPLFADAKSRICIERAAAEKTSIDTTAATDLVIRERGIEHGINFICRICFPEDFA